MGAPHSTGERGPQAGESPGPLPLQDPAGSAITLGSRLRLHLPVLSFPIACLLPQAESITQPGSSPQESRERDKEEQKQRNRNGKGGARARPSWSQRDQKSSPRPSTRPLPKPLETQLVQPGGRGRQSFAHPGNSQSPSQSAGGRTRPCAHQDPNGQLSLGSGLPGT